MRLRIILLIFAIILFIFISCSESSYQENWWRECSGFYIYCISGEYLYTGIGNAGQYDSWSPVMYTVQKQSLDCYDKMCTIGDFPGEIVILPAENGIYLIQATSEEYENHNHIDYDKYGCRVSNLYIWQINSDVMDQKLLYNGDLLPDDDLLKDAVIHQNRIYLIYDNSIAVFDLDLGYYSILSEPDNRFTNELSNNHAFVYGNSLYVSTYDGEILAVDINDGSCSMLINTTYSYDDVRLSYSEKYGYIVHGDILYYWDSDEQAMMSLSISSGTKMLLDDDKWGFVNADDSGLTIRVYNSEWIETGGDWSVSEYNEYHVSYKNLFGHIESSLE